MLTIRISKRDKEMITYLKMHKVRYTDCLKPVISKALEDKCKEFKLKEKRINNAPEWVYK